MNDSKYDCNFDLMLEGLQTGYGKFEAILEAVDNFYSEGISDLAIDPKHILTVAEHYENKEDFYGCLVLRLYNEASLLYESFGDLHSAYEVLKQRDVVKRGIFDKYYTEFPDDELDGLCVLKERRRNGERFNWVEQGREHYNGLSFKVAEYDKILKEWSLVPEIYLELRQKYHLPVKFVELAIEDIMARGSPIPVKYIEMMKSFMDEFYDNQDPCKYVYDIRGPFEEIVSGGSIENTADKHMSSIIHSLELHFNVAVLKDSGDDDLKDPNPVRAFEEIGAFRRASRTARGLFGDEQLAENYENLANYLSSPVSTEDVTENRMSVETI